MSLFSSTGMLLVAPAGADAISDSYAQTVIGLDGLVAYWRMNAANAIVDASGHGHDGTISGTPTLGLDLTESWQDSDGRSVDFGGAGYGEVPHDQAFNLAQGTLSFWFEVNALASDQDLVGKARSDPATPDDQIAVRVRTDGVLSAAWQRGGSVIDLETAAGVIQPGEAHHVVLSWSEKIVRMWLDGRQVAKSSAHTTGLTANDLPWRFAIRPGDDTPCEVVLDEIVLYDHPLLFDDVQTLSQFTGGLGYLDAQALVTINMSTSVGLSSALAFAQPGDHLVLASGTYAGPFTCTASGRKANPIVIRSGGGGQVTIAGDFTLEGDRIILAGVSFTSGGGAQIRGHHCRVTRCRNQDFTGNFGAIVRPGAFFARIDHCRLGPPVADSGGSSFTNQPLRIRSDGDTLAEGGAYALCDHLDLFGAATELGNGRDIFSIGNDRQGFTYAMLHRSILDQGMHDEGISLKNSLAFVQHCTFKTLVYVQNRHGYGCEWRSNYYEGCGHNDFGRGHWHIGNTYDGSGNDLHLPPGDVTQADFMAGLGGRPASEAATIIGCTFLNAARADAGKPEWETAISASGASAAGCTAWNVTYSASYQGTITHAPTTSEPFDVAVRLTGSDVGPDALDPLVPPGWK